ncbi:hypothetical protein [Desulfitobacterium chlororespirans]|uniref:Uncharacterized protein n=1 Tax=Desulfitobacterium chlororespirans DSM 11544 TaxID=1121395 RepID=A0A1M7UYA0_9FIRM|nr:hypothetical protein [Desulfitobacterium chlororespirans]SHN87925.1 hypothetical protein SAMN02745215_05032 [Desulfitobacterium chlororespirans DSM 11544]
MLDWIGEFWMDYGSMIIAISAAITLLGAVFTLFKNNSISTKAVDRTDQAERVLLAENKTLSAEHKTLAAEQKILLERTADNKAALGEVQKVVTAIDKRAEMEKEIRETRERLLDPQQFAVKEAVDKIYAMSENWQRLITENAGLREQVVELRHINGQLREQIQNLEIQQDETQSTEEWER